MQEYFRVMQNVGENRFFEAKKGKMTHQKKNFHHGNEACFGGKVHSIQSPVKQYDVEEKRTEGTRNEPSVAFGQQEDGGQNGGKANEQPRNSLFQYQNRISYQRFVYHFCPRHGII